MIPILLPLCLTFLQDPPHFPTRRQYHLYILKCSISSWNFYFSDCMFFYFFDGSLTYAFNITGDKFQFCLTIFPLITHPSIFPLITDIYYLYNTSIVIEYFAVFCLYRVPLLTEYMYISSPYFFVSLVCIRITNRKFHHFCD